MCILMKLRKSRAARDVAGYSIVSIPAVAVGLLVALFPAVGRGGPPAETAERPAAADWPMWRYDAGRSAASPAPLAAELHLQWVRQLPAPAPAWPEEQYKLQFDRSYEPVVMGRQIFVPSMVRDKVVAYDTDTGRRNWQFFCEGPVRFAPIAWRGKVYVVSDDGWLYCLDATSGGLLWRYRLAPSDRRVLGNGRLISAWPARGGPVLYDGTIYCTASIWPFMGVFIYAIDAETGQVVWENSGSSSIYIKQQHSSPAFAGVAPQGYMAATQDKLLISSRTVPACYDRNTGKLLYYHLSDRTYGKHVGGYDVSVWRDWFFNNGVAYRLSDGLGLAQTTAYAMGTDAVIAREPAGNVMACTLHEVKVKEPEKGQSPWTLKAQRLWRAPARPALETIYLQAGHRLYGTSGDGSIVAVDSPAKDREPSASWSHKIDGTVWTMLAGDAKLFVVTQEGRLYCFGERETRPKRYRLRRKPPAAAPEPVRLAAERILKQDPLGGGYGLWLGVSDGELLREIVRQSEMQIIVVERAAGRAAALRRRWDRHGIYGSRVTVLTGDMASLSIPPYVMSLIVVEDPAAARFDTSGFVQKVFEPLRPYGGTAILLDTTKDEQLSLYQRLADAHLHHAQVERHGDTMLLRRVGALPGAADWTHQYGDVANTVCSQDRLKLPLGLLWFGEDSQFTDVLPRHAHGPPQQVVAGRLFIQGIDSISARDVYTGRTLWKKPLKKLNTFGLYYDRSYKHDFRDLSYNQEHLPGANVRGTNFVATADRLYVVQENECHVLEARTGRTLNVLSLPDRDGRTPKDWGYIGVYQDYLIAGSDFVSYSTWFEQRAKVLGKWFTFFDKSASRQLVVMDRFTGDVLWTLDAQHGFLHNAIVAGSNTVYCLDGLPPYVRAKAAEKDLDVRPDGRLLALDIGRGRIVWEKRADNVFGSWLSYSEPYDILLQAHRKSRDMLSEPGDRMATYHAGTGQTIWDRKIDYSGPCMLHHGRIITQESAYSLLTGRQVMRSHPLTGEDVPWRYSRNYGCATAVASENLLTFRSAAAGFFDLTDSGGTGNWGGFKSGCTSNLVVADGVLNAPDYTRTCTCSYQNQTSLAMVHMPDVETWTFSDIAARRARIRRVGINLGAPGDRIAENDTLWLDYPSVGGTSPGLTITTVPERPQWFRRHSSRLEGGTPAWVHASGARGMTSVCVHMTPPVNEEETDSVPDANDHERPTGSAVAPSPYTVRLHFVEPDHNRPGQRVFDVVLQGATVLKGLDIVRETGSPNVGLVKEFAGVGISDTLTVSLTASTPQAEPVLCGIEIIAER